MSGTAQPRGRVLMVVSAVSTIPGSDARTGFFLEELTHPYLAVHEAGCEVDIATIPGGPAPIDPHSDPREPPSVSKVQDDIVSMGFVNSPRHMAKLADTLRLADADLRRYDAIFFAGGAGAIFDFPASPDVHRAIRAVWEEGRVVGAVCHGSAALFDATLSDGSPLVRGMEVTGLSAAEEEAIHAAEPHFTTPRMMEDEFPRLGTAYHKVPPNQSMVVTSGAGGWSPDRTPPRAQRWVRRWSQRLRHAGAGWQAWQRCPTRCGNQAVR